MSDFQDPDHDRRLLGYMALTQARDALNHFDDPDVAQAAFGAHAPALVQAGWAPELVDAVHQRIGQHGAAPVIEAAMSSLQQAAAPPAEAGLRGSAAPDFQYCPVPGYTKLNQADPATGQGAGGYHSRSGGRHDGVDITAPTGTPVVSPGNGRVFSLANDPNGFGQQIIIDNGPGFDGQHIYTQFGHLSGKLVGPGEPVAAGQQIGLSGRTGNARNVRDPHVHYETRVGSPLAGSHHENRVNPTQYLPPWCFD